MSNYITTSGSTTTIDTYSSGSQLGSHEQSGFSADIPLKYQEVARLAEQYSGARKDWKDDKFLLKGIYNLLQGKV